MPAKYPSLWDRLVANITIDDLGCWIWIGPVRRHGGGVRPALSLRVPGVPHPRQFNAARVMTELVHGPAPEGHEASHLCEDEWLCVCPDHLIWETKTEEGVREFAGVHAATVSALEGDRVKLARIGVPRTKDDERALNAHTLHKAMRV